MFHKIQEHARLSYCIQTNSWVLKCIQQIIKNPYKYIILIPTIIKNENLTVGNVQAENRLTFANVVAP